MRHKYKGRKLGTSYAHTKAMKVSLVQALFTNDRIKTTETRAKEIRGNVDKIITWAKRGDLHSRRLAIAALGNNSELVREVFEKVNQGMFKDRAGGYTRIMKLGNRKGDGTRMVIMELINETVAPKTKKAAAPQKATAKKKAATETSGESTLERIEESIEAAEEEFSAEVREEGAEQLAAEKAEAEAAEGKENLKEAAAEALEKKEAEAQKSEPATDLEDAAKESEEATEVAEKAEEEAALDAKAEDNAPNSADMPESEEKAK